MGMANGRKLGLALAAALGAQSSITIPPPPSTSQRPPNWVQAFRAADILKVLPDRGHHPNIYVTAEVFTEILNHIVNCGVFYKACIAAGISMRYFGKLREAFPVMEELTQDALEIYRCRVAEAIHSRAIDGWDEPVFYQGVEVGSIRRYSDRLLEMQAKRHMPEYRDHTTTDVNVSGGVLVVHAPAMSREQWLADRRKADAIESGAVATDVHDGSVPIKELPEASGTETPSAAVPIKDDPVVLDVHDGPARPADVHDVHDVHDGSVPIPGAIDDLDALSVAPRDR
jgi:hypothetical protein